MAIKKKSTQSKKSAPVKKAKRQARPLIALRGFKDILPEEGIFWSNARKIARSLLDDYGYGEIQTPIVEQALLYKRTTGEHTDIVSKEMFCFEDKAGENVSLRPEFTPGTARAYVEHGMLNRPQPVKLYSIGPVFRYDRPQAGRFRQFNQLNIEILGDESASRDAEIIFLSHLFCKQMGIDSMVQINSLGTPESREEYISILKDYYKPKKRLLCEDCKKRITKNPLRLLDCKESSCSELITEAPQLIDHLDEESKQHFVQVLEHLDESEVAYELNPYIVRGLDYYNRTAFEIVPIAKEVHNKEEDDNAKESSSAGNSRQNAIGGGGRYDGLIELIGGRPTAGVGMAFGLERVIDAAKKSGQKIPKQAKPQVFLAQLGEEAGKRSFAIFEQLRSSGIQVRANFAKDGLKQQLELADKLGVVYTVILGQKELLDETIIIRDMENGIQEVVDLNKIIEELKKRLKH